VILLFNNGVVDIQAFLFYSKQSYQEILSPIGTKKLLTLSQSMQQDIRDIKIYGEYVFTHDLVAADGDLNLDAVDTQGYQVYLCLRHREGGKALQAAVGLELSEWVTEKQACLALKTSLLKSLDILSTTMKINDKPPTQSANIGNEIRQHHVTLDTPPPYMQDAGTPLTGKHTGTQDYVNVAPLTGDFLRKLDYPKATEPADLWHMVTPTKEELETPMQPDGNSLTPGHGRPATDRAYINHLQNPDTYGAIAMSKQLWMKYDRLTWRGNPISTEWCNNKYPKRSVLIYMGIQMTQTPMETFWRFSHMGWCHDPLHQDSFGPREMGLLNAQLVNEHPLCERSTLKPKLSHQPLLIWEVNSVDASHKELNLGIPSPIPHHMRFQQMFHRFSPFNTFVSKSARFVSPSSFPTHRIPAATASWTAW
jgi:hypothetical protein